MLNALVPVFSLILLGVFLNYLAFPGAEFWRGAERLTYYLLFPSLLFHKLSTMNVSGGIQLLPLAMLLIGMLMLASIILVVVGYLLNIRAAAFTSLYQGGIRFNTYVGLAAVNGLWGDSGVAIAAVVVGIMIPVVNLLCISVFAYATESAEKSMTAIGRTVVTNPLILACVLGIIWNKLGLVQSGLFGSVLDLLSAAALPLGLLAVGAGVHFGSIGSSIRPLIASSIIKLLVLPSLAYIFCLLAGIDASVTMIVVVIAGLPTASSAYILSRELGGDSKTMAAIITGQTFVAMISLPLVVNYLV